MSDPAAVIQVQVNGEPREAAAGQPLAAWLAALGLTPQSVLVEHNGQALFRTDWERIHLSEGDRLEILRVVAGG